MESLDVHSLRPVGHAFFARDPATVAREVLGKILVSSAGDTLTGGRIVESEAYLGANDSGSHAATRGITARNEVMYRAPGCAYVYFTYGNHHMLNFVVEQEGTAGAVLVRAIEPLLGVLTMQDRRAGRSGASLTNGPGKVAAALGIDLRDNGAILGTGRLTLYDAPAPTECIESSGRVGLSSGHELQLRFYLAGNGYVSKGRTGPKPTKRTGGPQGKVNA